MADAEAEPAHAAGQEPVQPSLAEVADRELSTWAAKSHASETGTAPPWPEREARTLVEAVVDCVLGKDLGHVDAPARRWARTNPSLGTFARRLGCLKTGFGAHVPVGISPSSTSLGSVLDRVAGAATEEWLTALGLAHTPVYVEPSPVRLGAIRAALSRMVDDRRLSRIVEDRLRLREAGIAALAGVAAAVAVLSLVASPPAPHGQLQAHGPGPQPTPAGQPPAGGRKHPAAALVVARRPGIGGASSGRAIRKLSGSDQGVYGSNTGSQGPGGGTGPSVPVPGGAPGGVSLPVPLPVAVPIPAPPSTPVPVSLTGFAKVPL